MVDIPGLTEDEIVEVLQKAAQRHAAKYCFGYNSIEDITQEAIAECIIKLNKGKFKPKPDKDIKKQLAAFLGVCSRNAQSNHLRKHSYRYASGDTEANRTKYNLMHPLKIHSQGLTRSDIFARDSEMFDEMEKQQLMDRIRGHLNIEETKDFLKYLNGVKVPKRRLATLFTKVAGIIGEETQDSIDT
jgi:hypothetical protein